MQRLVGELTANAGCGIKGSTKIRKADKGRPTSFNTEPRVTLDFNFMG